MKGVKSMAEFGLMTEAEVAAVNSFDVTEETSDDAMAWSWTVAGKIVLGVAGAFL